MYVIIKLQDVNACVCVCVYFFLKNFAPCIFLWAPGKRKNY